MADGGAGDLAGFSGGNGAVKMGVVVLAAERLVALGFGGVVIKMQHTIAAPAIGFGQEALQQAAAVAVAAQEQFGLLGGVGGNFGIKQALAVAGGGEGGRGGFKHGNGQAVFGQGAGGGRTGNARADNQRALGRGTASGRGEPRFLRLGFNLCHRLGLPAHGLREMLVQAACVGGGQQP